jgi:hypothetical protein
MNAVIFTSRLCKVEEAGSVDDDHPTIATATAGRRRSVATYGRGSRCSDRGRGQVCSEASVGCGRKQCRWKAGVSPKVLTDLRVLSLDVVQEHVGGVPDVALQRLDGGGLVAR